MHFHHLPKDEKIRSSFYGALFFADDTDRKSESLPVQQGIDQTTLPCVEDKLVLCVRIESYSPDPESPTKAIVWVAEDFHEWIRLVTPVLSEKSVRPVNAQKIAPVFKFGQGPLVFDPFTGPRAVGPIQAGLARVAGGIGGFVFYR